MAVVVTPVSADHIREEREQHEAIQEREDELRKLKAEILEFACSGIVGGGTAVGTCEKINDIMHKIFEEYVGIHHMTYGDQAFNLYPADIAYEINYRTRSSYSSSSDNDDFLGIIRLPSLEKLEYIHVYNIDPTFNPDWVNMRSRLESHGMTKEQLEQLTLTNLKTGSLETHTHALFTIGSLKRYVYAVMGIDGLLYFTPWMNILYANAVNNADAVYRFYEKPLKFQNTTKIKYTQHTGLLTKDILTLAILRLLRDTRHRISTHSINQMITALKKIISSFYANPWTDADGNKPPTLDGLSYALLMNQSRVYRDGISKVLSHNQRMVKQAYTDGLNVGMKLFSNMAKCGFVMNQSTGKWTKEVKLVPWKCYWKDILWKIKEDYRKWEVTTLTIDSKDFKDRDLVVEAIGNHPNISSDGFVCLGSSMVSKWERIVSCDISELDPTTLPCFFNQIEETLEIINFDSPYQYISEIDGLKEHGLETYTEDHSEIQSFGAKTWTELD